MQSGSTFRAVELLPSKAVLEGIAVGGEKRVPEMKVRTQHHRWTAIRLENKVRERVQDGVMKAATVALSP